MRVCEKQSLLAWTLLGLASLVQAQQTCNGYAELCDKRYDQVVTIGAHNSYAVSLDASNIAANQAFNVTTQLRNGIRLLQGQGHRNNNTINLCHTSCFLLNGGPMADYLSKVKTWLDDNPNEVLTMIWVNSDKFAASDFDAVYKQAGIDQYVYTPEAVPVKYGSWPTLQQLISANTRIVSFLDAGADVSSVPYLLDQFSHVWETPFDQTDDTFPCTVDRPRNQPEGRMYLVNHYLDVNTTVLGQDTPIPDIANLNRTNSQDAVLTNVQNCVNDHQQNPTFILVDYYDRGDGGVFQAAASLNGVTYNAVPIGNASLANGGKGQTSNNGNSVDSTSAGHIVVGTVIPVLVSIAGLLLL